MSNDFTVQKPERVRCGKCLKDYSNKPGENHYQFVCGGCAPKMPAGIDFADYEFFDDPETGSVDRAFIEEDPVVTTVYLDNSWFLNAGIDAPVDCGIFTREEKQKRTDANFPDAPDYIGVSIALDLAAEQDRANTMELKQDSAGDIEDDGENPFMHPSYFQKKNALSQQVGGNHYKNLAIQPAEFCYKNNMGFLEGSVIKYVTRHKAKNGAEDIKKAIHFLNLILELEYGEK